MNIAAIVVVPSEQRRRRGQTMPPPGGGRERGVGSGKRGNCARHRGKVEAFDGHGGW